jgi:hypothetical protein
LVNHDCTTEKLRISASLLILIEEVKCIRTAETKIDGVDGSDVKINGALIAPLRARL